MHLFIYLLISVRIHGFPFSFLTIYYYTLILVFKLSQT